MLIIETPDASDVRDPARLAMMDGLPAQLQECARLLGQQRFAPHPAVPDRRVCKTRLRTRVGKRRRRVPSHKSQSTYAVPLHQYFRHCRKGWVQRVQSPQSQLSYVSFLSYTHANSRFDITLTFTRRFCQMLDIERFLKIRNVTDGFDSHCLPQTDSN